MLESILGGIFVLVAIYMLASTSGLFAERSGTINLSINAGMIMGAIGYVMASKLLIDSIGGMEWWIPIVGSITGILFSIMATSLLAVAAINLRGNQIIVGTAINVLAPIISLIIIIAISNGQQFLPTTNMQIITTFPSNGSIKTWVIQLIILIVAIIIVSLLALWLRKTKTGLRLRAAGENPHALESAGVSVFKIRHLGMLISGALAGLAGSFAVSSFIKFSSFTSSVYGMGFIALAILIFGQWRVHWVVLGAVLFSTIYILAYIYGPELDANQWYVFMVPYAAIIISLPLISRNSNAPKAEGVPYYNTGR